MKEQATQAQEQVTIAFGLAQKQSDLDRAKIDDLELAFRVASLPSISSPVPNTNLLPTLSAAVPIDEHRLDNAISEIRRDFDGKLYDLHNILPNVATVSTGPQISFKPASCQSRAKANQCQVEPELSQS